MTRILLYAEDRLLEALGRRVARHLELDVLNAQITNGRARLERQLKALNRAARTMPVLALMDRDRRGSCPGAEVSRLLPSRDPAMHLRLAVEEADAWLLADREGIARLLGLSIGKIPSRPEDENDPKQVLVNLARRARSKDLQRIAPPPGMSAAIGPAYNPLLCEFVARQWSIDRARQVAPSLDRCLAALQRTHR